MSARLSDLRTPTLILDRPVVAANSKRMIERAQALGVDLRPHLKTAKCLEVATLACAGMSGGITVSTLAEAAYFAERGIRDITYAVGIVPSKLDDVAAIESANPGARIQLLTDDVGVASAVAERGAAVDRTFRVLLEVDTGLHRTGFDAATDAFLEAGRRLHESPHVELCGVLSHAGNSYDCSDVDAIRQVATEERDGTVAAAERLEQSGIPCATRSVGSTPTAVHVDHLRGITEMRPGNYVFFDTFQERIGSCAEADIGVSVLATIIAHSRSTQRVMIDAGALALSKDLGPACHGHDVGYGVVRDESLQPLPGANRFWVANVNQEHGFVACDGQIPWDALPIGSRLRVLPNHSCMTAAAYDRYHVVDGGLDVVAQWQRVNGW